MKIPEDLKYTKSHEWVKIEGDCAIVGITEFAVDQLGDVTLVEPPEVGDKVTAKDSMGTIESVKAVSDLYSPVTGEVSEINGVLEDAPEKVNDDCYGDGWIVKIGLADESGVEDLMDSATYEEHLDNLD